METKELKEARESLVRKKYGKFDNFLMTIVF
jgi:hypothetical protein